MSSGRPLRCVLPWKALFMDERDGRLSALPCCANWIKGSFGPMDEDATLESLWNGPGAQEIRRLLAEGRQDDLCAVDCPWLASGRFAEDAARIIPGPAAFVENQRLCNEEIQQRRTELRSRPMALRLIPTLRCNISCRMCHQDHNSDLRLPARFLTDVRALGPCLYDYQLHGGEVLIARRLEHWADPVWFAENPQMLLSLITNATRLPARAWEILEAVRINYITVSLNAASREMYRHVAGADLFDDAVENVARLRELGRSHGLRKFEVYLSFVIIRSNFRELPDFVRLASSQGLPFRLLLVVGDRLGESIYTLPDILPDILASLAEAEQLAPETSRPEITRVRDSLRQTQRAAERQAGRR